MKWLSMLNAALLLSVGILVGLAWAEQGGPEQVIFQGKGKLGSVTFSHKSHADQGSRCQLCHHSGADVGKCSNCHDSDAKIPSSQDAFHLICVGCHKHKKIDVSCENCHKN